MAWWKIRSWILDGGCQDSALFHRAKTTKKVRVINDDDHRE
jgi:hypothetical protein